MSILGFLVYWLPWPLQRDRRTALTLGVFGALLVLVERWLLVPADVPWNLALGFAANAVISALLGGFMSAIRTRSVLALGLSGIKMVAAVAIVLALGLVSAEWLHAGAYQALGNVKVESTGNQAFSAVDLNSIVVVPEQTARNKARQVVGAYGSQFSLGNYYLQRVKGQLFWVAPLEFAAFQTQMTAGVSPGYVMVSATDPLGSARLVTDFKLKYLQSAFWGQWLDRHLRQAYPDLVFSEASFELDETGKPYWVMSAGHYEIGTGAVRIDRAIILDPQSGDSQAYALKDVPAWADQVIPAAIATNYSSWWGEYNGGWWNSVWGRRGVKIITEVGNRTGMVGVNGADGRFYWFSGMTSPNKADTSLIGYMMMDARSAAMSFHTLPGIASEEYVETAVANTFKAQRYEAGYPLPYNIYGEFTWAVPVLDSLTNGQLMAVSLVSADATRIVSGKTLDEALRLYKSSMGVARGVEPAPTASLKATEGSVERIAPVMDQAAAVYYIVLKEQPGRVFSAPLGLSPYLPVTRPGDHIAIRYADTTEALAPITTFKNLDLESR